ncbi:hypothetical protein chiPu_0024818 [Chiloscyllium punctatum]|uniref:Uncharacterized protein n=1 Tax=Chiloscyllium punctatum TaxID=137246 RepID=A0A401TDH3_CHIPU|nr:hypothetical protein [Chiloscyllium punctatum]
MGDGDRAPLAFCADGVRLGRGDGEGSRKWFPGRDKLVKRQSFFIAVGDRPGIHWSSALRSPAATAAPRLKPTTSTFWLPLSDHCTGLSRIARK